MAVATASMVPPTEPTSPNSTTQNPMTFGSPNPHSQYASAQVPHSQLPPPPQGSTMNTPMFSQQEVLRFIQAAVLATQRQFGQNQGSSAASDPSASASSSSTSAYQAPQPSTSILPEERTMKPRVHMYASHYNTTGSPVSPKGSNPPSESGTGEGVGTMLTTLELPGLRKSDISITARPNGELVVSGERRPQHLSYLAGLMDMDPESSTLTEKEAGRTVFNELKFGRFQRVFRLPEGTDPSSITASMDDGMLIISWPVPNVTFFTSTPGNQASSPSDSNTNDPMQTQVQNVSG